MTMDITNIDVVQFFGAIAAVITGITAFVKALKTDSNTKKASLEIEAIHKDRDETAIIRDAQTQELKTEIEVLKNVVANHGKQLADGTHEFESIRSELKEQNGLLREILGALKIKFNIPIDGNGTL